MAKDPAFLFYPNDWVGGTMGMTFEEKGAYMELLMMQFNRGHMTSHMIGQTVGQLWGKVQDKFVKDKDGLWYNERLEEEKNKRKKYTESRRNNLSGQNQYPDGDKKDCGHMGNHMGSHMEDEDINKDIIKEGESEGKKKETVIYREDYDKFLKETDSEPYHAFVKFLFGVNPNINKMDRCLSLGYQIDHARFQELMKLYPRDLIKTKVEAMENKIDLTKKYKSFYLTLKNWCKAG